MIQQTSENVRLIQGLLQRLEKTARTTDLFSGAADPLEASLTSTDTATAFFNIAHVKSEVHAAQSPSKPRAEGAFADIDEVPFIEMPAWLLA